MSVGLHWETESASKPEVCQLDVAMLVNEEVLRLQISVHDSVRVAVGRRLQDLIGEGLDLMGRQRPAYLAHVLLEIVVAVLEDEVELVLAVDDFLEPNRYIRINLMRIFDCEFARVLTLRCWGA